MPDAYLHLGEGRQTRHKEYRQNSQAAEIMIRVHGWLMFTNTMPDLGLEYDSDWVGKLESKGLI